MRMVPTLSTLACPALLFAGAGPEIDDVVDQGHCCSASLTPVIE